MLPISLPFLAPATSAPPGAAPVPASGGSVFASLLPDRVAPVMPRQGDAEGGKDLPASPDHEDDAPANDPGGMWIAPPPWRAVCAPAVVESGVFTAPAPVAAPTLIAATLPSDAAPQAGDAAAAFVADEKPAPLSTAQSGGVATLPTLRPHREASPITGAPMVAVQAIVPALPANGTTAVAHIPGMPIETAIVAQEGGANAGSPAPMTDLMARRASRGVKGSSSSPAQVACTASDLAPRRGGDGAMASVPANAPGVAQPRPRAIVEALPPPPPPRIAPAPAAQVFAAAIQQVMQNERHGERPDPALSGIATAAGIAPNTIAAVEAARHGALDMARDTWPAKMIERIEMMRDAMNAVDTSIRLIPDKLGTIDVSIRKDGDAVAVHFNAQQAETRQLLADAQPRLAEMAEARGLRLSTQTGDGGQQQQQQQQQANAAASPRLTPHDAPYPAPSPADERVA